MKSLRRHLSFLTAAGFLKSTGPNIRDMFRDISVRTNFTHTSSFLDCLMLIIHSQKEVAPADVISKVEDLPLTFSSWTPELYEETMRKQQENFGHNPAWVMAYKALAARGRYEDVMVVFNAAKEQVGWTLMCSHDSPFCKYFAFLNLVPSKEKTGLIACVGIDKTARGQKIGQAM